MIQLLENTLLSQRYEQSACCCSLRPAAERSAVMFESYACGSARFLYPEDEGARIY